MTQDPENKSNTFMTYCNIITQGADNKTPNGTQKIPTSEIKNPKTVNTSTTGKTNKLVTGAIREIVPKT